MNEVILFEHNDFRGAHKHVFDAEANLGDPIDNFFNDKVSSLVVVSGEWLFYRNANFNTPYPRILAPGRYANVTDVGIQNDDMSSLRSL
jgi:hypothetical protein